MKPFLFPIPGFLFAVCVIAADPPVAMAPPSNGAGRRAAPPAVEKASATLQPGTGRHFFAAPEGRPDGDGSKARPWDLRTALTSPAAVKPGDTVWLRGGVYAPAERLIECRMKGAAGRPVMVASFPGEQARVAAYLRVYAANTWFWNVEIFGNTAKRSSGQAVSWPPSDIPWAGIDVMTNAKEDGPDIRLINLNVHDCNSSGVQFWKEAIDSEVYGCLIWSNGWKGPDRWHGHGIYTQNKEGTKRYVDNFIFKNGMLGISAYGSGQAYLEGFHFEGNVLFHNGAPAGKYEPGLLLGGGRPVLRTSIINNFFYHADRARQCASIGYYYGGTLNEGLTLTDNYFAGKVFWHRWKSLAADRGNMVYGELSEETRPAAMARMSRETNRITMDKPKGTDVFVRPNRYTPGRANVAVYNWDRAQAIRADLKDILAAGESYEVRDVQDWSGEPAARGTYDGKAIVIPMTGRKAARDPAFDSPLMVHTAPEFGAFIVVRK